MSNQQDDRRQGWVYRSDHDKIKRTDKPRRTGCPWSPKEDKDLREAFARLGNIDAIAAIHERSSEGVLARLAINMSALLDITRVASLPEPENASFAVGSFVLYEFRLYEITRIDADGALELRGSGYLTNGRFNPDELFPLTMPNYNDSRGVEGMYDEACDKARGMNINNPGIRQLYVKGWLEIMRVPRTEEAIGSAWFAMREIHLQVCDAILAAKKASVAGVKLFRQ